MAVSVDDQINPIDFGSHIGADRSPALLIDPKMSNADNDICAPFFKRLDLFFRSGNRIGKFDLLHIQRVGFISGFRCGKAKNTDLHIANAVHFVCSEAF